MCVYGVCMCLWWVRVQVCSGVAAGPRSTDTGPWGWERSWTQRAPAGAGWREVTLCGCDAGPGWELRHWASPVSELSAPGLDFRAGRQRSVGQPGGCQSTSFAGPGSPPHAHLCQGPPGFQEPSGRKREGRAAVPTELLGANRKAQS